jgi:hypothetical protein
MQQTEQMFFRLGTGNTLKNVMQAADLFDPRVEHIETRLESAHREYLDSIASYRHRDGYAVPGELIVARGESR